MAGQAGPVTGSTESEAGCALAPWLRDHALQGEKVDLFPALSYAVRKQSLHACGCGGRLSSLQTPCEACGLCRPRAPARIGHLSPASCHTFGQVSGTEVMNPPQCSKEKLSGFPA